MFSLKQVANTVCWILPRQGPEHFAFLFINKTQSQVAQKQAYWTSL